jgi:hypothetical protein
VACAAISRADQISVDRRQGRWQVSPNDRNTMNDFLRPCNCVHPAEEDCEKCVQEAGVKKPAEARGEEKPQKEKPKAAESEKKI